MSWDSEFVTVVSGVPRSGTSLMMQMLGAGGVPLLVDDARCPDSDNPHGYFEYLPVKRSAQDVAWFAQAQGRAVKVIHTLLRYLPGGAELRIVLMERDLNEVLRSQRRMLERSGARYRAGDDARLAEGFAAQLRQARAWASTRPRTALLVIDHRDLLDRPLELAGRVDVFLGAGLDVEAMARQPDPELYRIRARSGSGC